MNTELKNAELIIALEKKLDVLQDSFKNPHTLLNLCQEIQMHSTSGMLAFDAVFDAINKILLPAVNRSEKEHKNYTTAALIELNKKHRRDWVELEKYRDWNGLCLGYYRAVIAGDIKNSDEFADYLVKKAGKDSNPYKLYRSYEIWKCYDYRYIYDDPVLD